MTPEDDDRKVTLEFNCAECGKHVQISNEKEIMDLVNSQLVAESGQLHCWDCVE